ncbi:MAG: 1-deoxy-D-xylulose-5-phosphate reductoisomerase [Fidelibacterota bacterium]
MKRRLCILGSTGSIGVNALKVVANLPDEFSIKVLTARTNWQRLAEQARRWQPDTVCIGDEHYHDLRAALRDLDITVVAGRQSLLDLAGRTDIDLVLNALVGSPGMEPTLRAVQAGVNVALSNKESLVMAGAVITEAAARSGARIFPVDSEHSAIWQCLAGESAQDIRRIILTGSGGPFRTRDRATFSTITREEALRHPNWSMGNKITIDSATMMNKGLEVIEAKWLFQLDHDQIDIVVHPQSIIHSMVEFRDASVKAQLGVPDMKVPIQYALTYPEHRPAPWERLDLVALGSLTFEPPDFNRFPCIPLAFKAMEGGGTAPAALNLANDQAVAEFLTGNIGFMDIPNLIASAMDRHSFTADPTLEDFLALEKEIPAIITEDLS